MRAGQLTVTKKVWTYFSQIPVAPRFAKILRAEMDLPINLVGNHFNNWVENHILNLPTSKIIKFRFYMVCQFIKNYNESYGVGAIEIVGCGGRRYSRTNDNDGIVKWLFLDTFMISGLRVFNDICVNMLTTRYLHWIDTHHFRWGCRKEKTFCMQNDAYAGASSVWDRLRSITLSMHKVVLLQIFTWSWTSNF